MYNDSAIEAGPTVNQGVAIMRAYCRYRGVDDNTTVIVPRDFVAGFLAAAYPQQTEGEPHSESAPTESVRGDEKKRNTTTSGASQPVGGEPEDAHNPTPPTRREAWEWRKRAIEAVADRDREKRYNVQCEAENAELRADLHAAEQRAEIARGNTQREYNRAAQLVHQVKVAEAEKLRQTANANEFQRKWEAAEQRAAQRAAEFRWKEMRDRITELEADRDRLEMRLESTERQLAVVDKELPAWENAERDSKHCVGRVDTIRNLVADRADRDRLEQEVIELHDRFNRDSDRIWTLEGERDRLQRENEQLKTLMRYGSEKCHDALRGLYKLVDRHGWISGLSKETRDVVLAKARAALKEERPA